MLWIKNITVLFDTFRYFIFGAPAAFLHLLLTAANVKKDEKSNATTSQSIVLTRAAQAMTTVKPIHRSTWTLYELLSASLRTGLRPWWWKDCADYPTQRFQCSTRRKSVWKDSEIRLILQSATGGHNGKTDFDKSFWKWQHVDSTCVNQHVASVTVTSVTSTRAYRSQAAGRTTWSSRLTCSQSENNLKNNFFK